MEVLGTPGDGGCTSKYNLILYMNIKNRIIYLEIVNIKNKLEIKTFKIHIFHLVETL